MTTRGATNRKFLFLTAAAMVALVGCSNGEHLDSKAATVADASKSTLKADEKQLNPSSVKVAPDAPPGLQPQDDNMRFRLLNLESQMTELRGDVDKLLTPLSERAKNGQTLDSAVNAIEARQKVIAQHLAEYKQNVAMQASLSAPAGTSVPVAPVAVAVATTTTTTTTEEAPVVVPAPLAKTDVQATDQPLAVAPPPPPISPLETEENKAKEQAAAPTTSTPSPDAALAKIAQATEAAPEPVTPPPASAAAPATTDAPATGVNITAVRFGEHPGLTRIVLDISGSDKFTYNVDNKAKTLMVELPGAGWTAAAQKTIKNPLVVNYDAKNNASGDGTTLVVTLAKDVKVKSATLMAPGDGYGERIVIDITGL